MKKMQYKSHCPLCGGKKVSGKTIYSVDLGFGVIMVRNVSAMVCNQCGEEWIDPNTATRLEMLVNEARQKNFKWRLWRYRGNAY